MNVNECLLTFAPVEIVVYWDSYVLNQRGFDGKFSLLMLIGRTNRMYESKLVSNQNTPSSSLKGPFHAGIYL